ncbi:hypothetical protein [Lysinibacillus sphaericus]|uniref:hypothetical protein n=1 Tax=Lysinibacillus sphaericus TaxID=1421 RepID=UPI0018CEFF53|nr:hypothetical protein [Lysinibacillus sphaericus]
MGKLRNKPILKEITYGDKEPSFEEKNKAVNAVEEVLINMFLHYYKLNKNK